MPEVFLGLGSNVGERKENIIAALELLKEKIADVKVAQIYESRAVGHEHQPNFLNTAAKGTTALKPKELLDFVKAVENEVGRVERFRWGPREIDIDILFYDDLTYKNEWLEIPHSYLRERDFVLKPLTDLAPDFTHPVFKKTIKQLLAELPEENLSIIKQESLS